MVFTFVSNETDLESIVSFFIGKKLQHQGINLANSPDEIGTDGKLFCKVQVNKKAIELGTTAFQVTFQINANLKSPNGQLIGKPFYQESPIFYIYEDQEMTTTFKRWLNSVTDDFIL